MKKTGYKIFTLFVALLFYANTAFAVREIIVRPPEGRNPMFSYDLFETGEYPISGKVSTADFPPGIIDAICAGSYEWNIFINNENQTMPVTISAGRINEENSYAAGEDVEVYTDETKTTKEEYKRTALNAIINGKEAFLFR